MLELATDSDSIVLDSFAGLRHDAARRGQAQRPRRGPPPLPADRGRSLRRHADRRTGAAECWAGYGTVPGLGGQLRSLASWAGYRCSTRLLRPARPGPCPLPLPALRQYVCWQETGHPATPAPAAPPDHPAYLGTAADGARAFTSTTTRPGPVPSLPTGWAASPCPPRASWCTPIAAKSAPTGLARHHVGV
ncbi:MAG: hypothetical protein WKG07_44890 [Hymenobacter sp.]